MKDIRIHVATETIIKTVLILLAFYLLFTIRDILLLLVASVVIAAAVEPAALWFVRHKIPRVPAVIIVYLCGLLVFSAIFYFFIPPLFQEIISFINQIPTYASKLDFFGTTSGSQPLLSQLTQNISLGDALGEFKKVAGEATGGFFQVVSTTFGGALGFILVIVLSFYLAVQERGIENFLKLVTPFKSQRYVVNLWGRAQLKIGRWLQGQLLLALIIGVLVFLGLTILSFQNAFFLAALAGLCELIPIFGPIIAAVPAVLIGFTISPTVALLTIALYIVVQQFENHLIQPLVMKKVIGISPLVAIISLIIGASLAGFLGIILSVPIAAVVMEFIGDVSKEKALEAEEAAEEAELRKKRKKEREEQSKEE
ncbi:MAG TPA: AI-2E family transporter [Candidatus Paceibacterota bacterium]|nr:AI-2E family transporter [Candidatus Paceibacterota bacterium]